MSRATIPKEMHERMVARLRSQYEKEFGPADQVVQYTREDLVAHYAAVIRFWQRRVPAVGPAHVSLPLICGHAICTNAISNMKELAAARGVAEEVGAALLLRDDASGAEDGWDPKDGAFDAGEGV